MSKWDKHSRKWEPSFKQRLNQQAEAKSPKPERKQYLVMRPRPRYDVDDNQLSAIWYTLMNDYWGQYKSLTYDEMIELKLRGYTVRTT